MTRGGDTRFRKGQSGNPKGRPKRKAPAASAFDVIFEKTLTVTQNGVERELSVEEALQQRTYQDALAGSRAARREVLRMIAKREKWIASHASPPKTGPLAFVVEEDPDNANAALLLLGIATPNEYDYGPNDPYERLLLEPWAVEVALKRLRTLDLSESDRALMRNSVRDYHAIAWP